jgi:hypothetical protein
VSIQKVAKLMMRSAAAVASRDMARLPDAAWRDGCADKALSMLAARQPAPPALARPEWLYPGKAELEAGG